MLIHPIIDNIERESPRINIFYPFDSILNDI